MEIWIGPVIRHDFKIMEYTRNLWVYSYKGNLPLHYGPWRSWNQMWGFRAYLHKLVMFPN